MENKTVYLLKMGMDAENGLNHRIRFTTTTNTTFRNEAVNICFDFSLVTPWYSKKGKTTSKTVYGAANSALGVETWRQYKEGCYGLDISNYPEELKKELEYLPAPFDTRLKYTYKNILTIINYFYKTNFTNLELVDSRYIKGFNYDTFKSDEVIIDFDTYEKAKYIEHLACEKIKSLKVGCKYDNSSYYFDGDTFNILIHYNCYNDIVKLDLSDFAKAIDTIKAYTIPEKEIREAIAQHGISSNKLYL